MSDECKTNGVRIDRLEGRVDRVEADLTAVKTEQAETRVYVKQILERIEDLRAMVSVKSSPAPADNGQNTKMWIDAIKWVVGGTIVALIAYIFGSGGGGV